MRTIRITLSTLSLIAISLGITAAIISYRVYQSNQLELHTYVLTDSTHKIGAYIQVFQPKGLYHSEYRCDGRVNLVELSTEDLQQYPRTPLGESILIGKYARDFENR